MFLQELEKIDGARIFIPEHVIVKLIDIRVVGDNFMILADAVNIQKMTHQINIGFFAFYKNEDLSLSVIH
jgi:hypothetical protein